MALTRVSRHIIDEPLELQNINATGIGTFASLRVTGDLQVDGTTTTLDTVVTEVDRLEVAANNSTVGAAITQTGSGDILNLYDGATEVFTVTDGGKVGVGINVPARLLHLHESNSNEALISFTTPTTGATVSDGFRVGMNGSEEALVWNNESGIIKFGTANTERIRVTSDGKVGVGEDNVQAHFHVAKNIADSDAINWTGSQLSVATPVSGNSTANRATIYFAPYGSDNNYAPSAISASAGTSGASTLKFFTNASGNLTGQVQNYERLRITSDGKVRVPDNGKFVAGAGDDLQIFHGSNISYVANYTGELILLNQTDDGDISIHSDNGSGGTTPYFRADGSTGDAILYHYGTEKLATKSTGILVTGQVNASTMHLTDGNGIHIGNSNDLRVYHDGNHSYVQDAGTGNLILSGTRVNLLNPAANETMVSAQADGPVELYYNNSLKLQTANGGVNIVGNLNLNSADSYEVRLGANNDLKLYHDGTDSWIDNTEGDLYLRTTGSGDDIIIRATDDVIIQTQGSEASITARGDGQVELYYDNNIKLETTSTGAKVTGALEVTQEYPTIRPTLDLNFAATKTLDRRITFTRDSVGTYVGEDGLVKYASNNVPRFDHDPDTRESLGLLIEESRTNYVDNSNDVSQWNRIINSATIESNTTDTLSPDGTNTSTKITGGNNSGISRDAILSVSTSTTYIASIFAKKGSTDSFRVEFGSGANQFQAIFNLTTKAFSNTSASGWFTSISTSYVDYPNGWVRVILTGTTGGSASGNPNFAVYGISSGYAYFWGAQAEVGSFVTSLIPTHGSTVTRSADFATIKGTNFTDFYNQTEGTLFGEFTIKDIATSSAAIANINQESGSSYAYSIMFVEIGNANGYFGRTFKNSSGAGLSSGSSVANLLHPSTTPQTVSFGYTSVSGGELRAYWNGDLVNSTSVTSYVPTTLTNMRIGRGWGGTDTINAHIRKLSYYPKRLPNAQLQGLTQQ